MLSSKFVSSPERTNSMNNICNVSFSAVDFQNSEPQFSYWLALLFGVPATLIIIVTVFGNFLVLCFKAKVGKRQTMLLIWNLGLADFLVGVIVLPMGVSYVIGQKWPFNRLLCRIWVSCDVIFCTASIVTLCVISIDRYIGVTRPLRYKLIVTKTKVIVSIIAIWIFSISILLATIRYNHDDTACYNPNVCHAADELEYVTHSVVFAFFLPTLVTLILYWKIYKVAKRRERGLAHGLILAMGQNFFKECIAVPLRIHCGKDTMSHQQQVIRMHKKVAKTLGVVVSAFVVCWGPFFSLYLIGYKCGCIPILILDITSWLGYCNSMINPVIYAFTVEEFKRSLKDLYGSIRHCQRVRCSTTQSDSFCTSAATTQCPPASNLPRSKRAYSIVAATEEQPASLLLPFLRSKKLDLISDERRQSRCEPPHENNTESGPAPNWLRRRSTKCASHNAVATNFDKRRRATISTGKRWSRDDKDISTRLIKGEEPLTNGTTNNDKDQADMGQISENQQPIWNAKLYCTLISPQSTGL